SWSSACSSTTWATRFTLGEAEPGLAVPWAFAPRTSVLVPVLLDIRPPLVTAQVHAFGAALRRADFNALRAQQRHLQFSVTHLVGRDAALGVDHALPRHVVLGVGDAEEDRTYLPGRVRRADHRGDLPVRDDLTVGTRPHDLEHRFAERGHGRQVTAGAPRRSLLGPC